MSNPLVKPKHTITIPMPSDEIGVTLTIIVTKAGQLQIQGPIQNRALCEELLRQGLTRLAQYHDYLATRENESASPALLSPEQAEQLLEQSVDGAQA